MLYINNTKQNLIFVLLIIALLLLDLGQFFLIGSVVIPLLLSTYCSLLCYTTRCIPLACVGLLQCLESFCFYNFFTLACVYLIPITILAFFFKKYLYPSQSHIILLTLSAFYINIYAIEGYFLHIWPTSYYYTIMRISAILLTAMCFSLTINIWGMQDNRA